MVPRREFTEGFNRFDLHALTVVQQAGAMTPGEVVVLVAAASDHRREAFPAADYLMDRLKSEAVFWKQERETFGERWIESADRDTQDREMME
ncbi:MAG: molybdenum cofactor biosynthesis protein MoaE [Parvibaculum sp.]|uniref:molybdenum cofactor biosynthesis protein MoaE n=1 Tax=Parvibaculum sp. TaxID=2024848 RepID=UPI001DF3BECD|nr:molybdenum cofactor biosynthesis protein MoaE [Parvibaculum sp.]MBX3489918.1 molybdenum cofactor biosynthesis protein MoaE [Parvibaculum sp.]MBX3494961.1 molybdenum cofactor biosynthesis protein MoaE [Parvibaculum sp.]MCW5726094.1 molybdenum cofactor biosynthesis protein MoaE [Parvibaculum sp.]